MSNIYYYNNNTIEQLCNPDEFKQYIKNFFWHGMSLLREINGKIIVMSPFTALLQKAKSKLFGPFGAIDYTQTDLVKRSVRNIIEQGAKKHLFTAQDAPLARDIALSVGLSEKQISVLISKISDVGDKEMPSKAGIKFNTYMSGNEQVKVISASHEITRDLAILEQQANDGDRESIFKLAKYYADDLIPGINREEALSEAAKWYHRAAELGDTEAKIRLASMYAQGMICEQQSGIMEAVKLYTSAAKAQSVLAMMMLGALYLNGRVPGIPLKESYVEAMKWYIAASEKGNSEAMYKIAMMYEEGRVEGVNEKESNQCAKQWYEKAVHHGETRSMYNLARMYERGLIESVEEEEADARAARLYQESAVNGNINAMIRLSQFYEDGKVPLTDPPTAREKARYWNREAVELLNKK